MRRVTRPLRTSIAVIALVVFVGCGSSSSKTAGPGGEAGFQQAARQDAAAKADARNLLTEVATCFTSSQDYSQCSTAAQLEGSGAASRLPIGRGRGRVEVSHATAASFTIVAHSQSGTGFTVTGAPSGAIKRTCNKPASGGCAADGTW